MLHYFEKHSLSYIIVGNLSLSPALSKSSKQSMYLGIWTARVMLSLGSTAPASLSTASGDWSNRRLHLLIMASFDLKALS